MKLSKRDIELLEGMIDVQMYHAERCQAIIDDAGGNVTMATKQKGWDMERVSLLRRVIEENVGSDRVS